MRSPISSIENRDEALIVDWIERFRQSTEGSPLAPVLDFEGINAIDVLLSPLYLAVLNTMRDGAPKLRPPGRAMFGGLRDWGYAAKFFVREQLAARHSAPIGPADILMWSRDITHTLSLFPVARALHDRHVSCRTMACQPGIFNRLREADPDAVFPLAAWPKAIHAARAEGARRAQQLATLPWNPPEFPGANIAQLGPAVRSTVMRLMPQVSEAIANARSALDRFGSKVLVVGNDLTPEGRAGCRVAASRGIKTASFMHGSITGDVLQAHHCAERVFVYGTIHRQQLIHQGLAPERITVCGAPNLDHLPRQSGQVDPLLRARLDLRSGEPWVLVATSGPGHRISYGHHAVVIQNLVALTRTFPELPLVIKLHRKDQVDFYQQGLKECGNARMYVVPHDAPGYPANIFDWLQGCRMVLTGASTVALEAMVMDVPVITMDFCDEVHNVDFIDAGATEHVTSAEGLQKAVREILTAGKSRPSTQAHVEAHLAAAFGALDGASARRGAESLCEMLQDPS